MIKKNYEVISQCYLFNGLEKEKIIELCDMLQPKITPYKKGQTLFEEGEICSALGIVLKGKMELSTFFISGDVSNLITMGPSDIFGEAILFSPNDHYPISITALSDLEVLYIDKPTLIETMEHSPKFLENYLGLLSKKLLFFNDKFKLLSLSTIRGKIAHVLIKLSKEQNSSIVKLPFSKEKMALHICTRRPSLSRELSKMKAEGLIDYEKSIIKILDYDALADELF
ncbi:MAG: Crp/Fnr family transcriptional regulator [Clostridiales bacterium]|nr:Crp/Fnr family transcriptional regulator [Clostridiales bacterium]